MLIGFMLLTFSLRANSGRRPFDAWLSRKPRNERAHPRRTWDARLLEPNEVGFVSVDGGNYVVELNQQIRRNQGLNSPLTASLGR